MFSVIGNLLGFRRLANGVDTFFQGYLRTARFGTLAPGRVHRIANAPALQTP